MNLAGVYRLVHVPTGRTYVGSSRNMAQRWAAHRKRLRAGIHENRRLQAVWSAHEETEFLFVVLETLETDNRCELIRREQLWLESLNPYFNLAPTAGSMAGYRFPEEFRQRRREQMIGNKIRLGKPPPEAPKALFSIQRKGRPASPAMLAHLQRMAVKRSATHQGKPKPPPLPRVRRPISPETRAKLSAAKRGNKSWSGKTRPPETRAKISSSVKAAHARRCAVIVTTTLPLKGG